MGDCGPGLSQTQAVEESILPYAEADEVSVLVTGFGPFRSYVANASSLIASSLPSSLTLPSVAPSSACPDGSVPASRRVSIHVHPTPVPVAYSTIRTMIPAILEEYAKAHGGRQPDIVVHMGIAATRNYYSVETQAHRDAYILPDINGRSGFQDGEMHWRSLGLPPTLSAGRSTDIPAASDTATTSLDSNPHPPDDRFLDVWRSFGPSGADLRLSRDAGRYACEFILYTSLALAFQKGENRSVAFLHVPGSCHVEDIVLGRRVAIAFIKALVECWFDRKT